MTTPQWYNAAVSQVTDEVAGGWGGDDTDPEAARVQAAILSRLPVWRRLAQVDDLYKLTTSMALADLRRRNPAASEAELRLALVERLRRAAVPPSRDDA